MSVPLGNVNGRNLVIASVGTSVDPASNYQESNTEPTERTNGGDLLPGDMWYNSINEILSVYTSLGWVHINEEDTERIEALEERVNVIEQRLNSAGI